jgi:glycopeptide antibiotics resistance protein
VAKGKTRLDKLKLFVLVQILFLIVIECVRIVQAWQLTDVKVLVLFASSMFSYVIKSIFEEIKKSKSEKDS